MASFLTRTFLSSAVAKVRHEAHARTHTSVLGMRTEIFLDMDKTSRFLEAAEELCTSLKSGLFSVLQMMEEMYAKADTVLYHNNVHAADVTGLQPTFVMVRSSCPEILACLR